MHVFISYAKKDTRDVAIRLYNALSSSQGITAWMDASLEVAESWALQIQQEIDRCDVVIVLLSPDVNRPVTAQQRRSFVLQEIDYAQLLNKPIIPVIVQPTKVPLQLAGIQYIDISRNPQTGYEQIIRQVHRRAGIREPQPAAPHLRPKVFLRRRIFCCPALALFLGCVGLIFVWLLFLPAPSKNGEFMDVDTTVTSFLMPSAEHHWIFNAQNGETGVEPVYQTGDWLSVRLEDMLGYGTLCYRIEAPGDIPPANCDGTTMRFRVDGDLQYNVFVYGKYGDVFGLYELTVEKEENPEEIPNPVQMVLVLNEAAVRREPFQAAPELGVVQPGVRLHYLGISDDHQYYQVEFEGQPGWIKTALTKLEE